MSNIRKYRMFLRTMFKIFMVYNQIKDYIKLLVVIIFTMYLFFVKGFYFILAWKITFLDSASPFMEVLVDLYYVVWYILIIILVGIIYLLSKMIYLFTWNMNFSTMSNFNLKNIISMYLSIILFIGNIFSVNKDSNSNSNSNSDKRSILKTLTTLNLVLNKKTILNFFYNLNNKKFLNVQGVAEYSKLEVIWCGMPTVALAYISAPTFGLIYSLDPYNDPGVTLKVIGRQWYWHYEYNVSMLVDKNDPLYIYSDKTAVKRDFIEKWDLRNPNKNNMLGTWPQSSDWELMYNRISKGLGVIHFEREFDSVMVTEDDLNMGDKRLLIAEPAIVLPVGVPVKILVTSEDVLHSWTIPNLGVKVDAVPGRINQFIFEIKYPGNFWGQCSELCGASHGFMPVTLHAVSEQDFLFWIREHSTLITLK